MTEQDEMERRVAVHEASHALAATALGFKLRRVQLGDPRFILVDTPGPERARAYAMVLMAGEAGEEVFCDGEPFGGGSDDPEIERLLRGDAELEAGLRRQVRLFIAGNYPAVRRVADALLRDGMMTGDEVVRLVRGRQR